ncbi:helix-turn-helix domain-containing protein [Heyndrickxia coagulans]|nr:helix-turn-helix domain-containing protein [Heyndrickxia coagulans]
MKKMQDYHWPGNIRELMNVIENVRLLALAGEEEAERYVDEYVSGQTGLCGKEKQDAPLTPREAIERDMILEALKHTKGNAAAAAKMLDIPRSTFYRKLRKYGL